MPKSPQQNESIRQARRKEILAAAIPIFARYGFSRTGLSDVARAAGIAHGTVFLYFASKDELFRAAVLEPLGEFELLMRLIGQEAVRAEEGEGQDPLKRIRTMVNEHVRVFSHQTDYLRLTQYVAGQPDRFPDLVKELDAFTQRFCAGLAPLIKDGQAAGVLAAGDPKIVALSYFSYLSGLGLTILGDPPDSPLWEKLAEQGVRLFGAIVR